MLRSLVSHQNTRESMPADQIEQRQPFGAAFDKPDNLSGRDRVPSKGVALSPRCSSPPLLGQMPPSNRTEVRVQLAPPSRRVRTIAISCSIRIIRGSLISLDLFCPVLGPAMLRLLIRYGRATCLRAGRPGAWRWSLPAFCAGRTEDEACWRGRARTLARRLPRSRSNTARLHRRRFVGSA